MSHPDDLFPKPEPGVDAVVRAQLDAEAARVEPAGICDRVLARLDAETVPLSPAPTPTPTPTPAATPRPRWTGLGRRLAAVAAVAGLAAAVLVAVVVLETPQVATATPAQVVAAARTAHARDGDRCYTQKITPPRELPGRFRLAADNDRETKLWVRGNAFAVEPGFGGRGAWGRDEAGRVWVAPHRDGPAARFEEKELPEAVREAARIRGLELDTLLGDVLKDFDLAWSEGPTPAGTDSVAATRRGPAGPGQLASADLVIEKDTNLVRSLTLRRRVGPEGVMVVAFSFVAEAAQSPAWYTAEGHIGPGQPVFDSGQPVRRHQVMARLFKEILLPNP